MLILTNYKINAYFVSFSANLMLDKTNFKFAYQKSEMCLAMQTNSTNNCIFAGQNLIHCAIKFLIQLIARFNFLYNLSTPKLLDFFQHTKEILLTFPNSIGGILSALTKLLWDFCTEGGNNPCFFIVVFFVRVMFVCNIKTS